MSDADDAQARKARADAIRRARDERNARIKSGDSEEADAAADETPEDDAGDSANYVDLIDQRMRRDQQDDK